MCFRVMSYIRNTVYANLSVKFVRINRFLIYFIVRNSINGIKLIVMV